LDVTIMD